MLIPEDKVVRQGTSLERGHEGAGLPVPSSSPAAMVNVVPAQVASIDRGLMRVWPQAENGDGNTGPTDSRVWLKAQIVEVVQAPEGRLLSLLVGSAQVSALVGSESDRFGRWASGMAVEIHVGRYEAWLKPHGGGWPPVLCGILYLDRHTLDRAR